MTQYRYTGDIPATISGQQQDLHHHYQPDTSTTSSSSSTSTSTTRTTTRVRACAREGDPRATMLHGQYVDVCEYYAQAFHRSPAPAIQREIATRIKAGMSADVLRAAIDDTMMAPRPSWAYMAAILRRCDLEGIRTLTDWRTSKDRYQAAKNPALNYEQRTYTEDMFGEDFFIDLDKYAEQHSGGDQA